MQARGTWAGAHGKDFQRRPAGPQAAWRHVRRPLGVNAGRCLGLRGVVLHLCPVDLQRRKRVR
jgi:hypothetical protein